MRRFGLKKDDDDGSKASLFSRKKDKGHDDNPYAQQKNDSYNSMTALQKTQADLGLRGGRPGLPSGPAPRQGANAPPPAYGSQPPMGGPPAPGPNQAPSGYSAGGYGASGGYGGNRYDNSNGTPLGRPPTYRSTAESEAGSGYGNGGGASAAPRLSQRRGGYGGLGGSGGDEDDPNRQALFGNAPEKIQQQQQQQPPPQRPAYGAADSGEMGGYGEGRELTAEEMEDQDVKRMNEETRYLRNETDQSLDRSLMIANQTIETARSTMARMQYQRERLYNAEQNLDQAANHNKIAEHRTAELKHYNRSMFAVKVNNPFTSKQRAAEKAQAALDEHREQRELREETRRTAYANNRNGEERFNQLEKATGASRQLGQSKGGRSSKFALEDDDEEDMAKEAAIDAKMDMLSGAVGTLNLTARTMNQMAEEDLDHLSRLAQKSDAVDDGVRANQYRLYQIEKKG